MLMSIEFWIVYVQTVAVIREPLIKPIAFIKLGDISNIPI